MAFKRYNAYEYMKKYRLKFNYVFSAMAATGIALALLMSDYRTLSILTALTAINLLIIKKLLDINQRTHSLFLRELSNIFELLLQIALILMLLVIAGSYLAGISKDTALLFALGVIVSALPISVFIIIYLIFNNFNKKLNIKNSLNNVDIGSVEYIIGESSELFNNKKLKFNEISNEIEQSAVSAKLAHIKLLIHDDLNNYHAKGLALKLGLEKIVHSKDLKDKTDNQIYGLISRGALLNNISINDKKRIISVLNYKQKYILACASSKRSQESYAEADLTLGSRDFIKLMAVVLEGRVNQINFNIIFRTIVATAGAGMTAVVFSLLAFCYYKIAPPLTPLLLMFASLILIPPLFAMAFDQPEKNYLKSKPKNPEEQIFNAFSFLGLIGFGVMTATLSFLAYLLYFQIVGVSPLNLTDFNVPLYHQATTLAFLTFSICTMLYIIFERADKHRKVYSDFLIDNPRLIASFGFNILILILVIYLEPLQYVLKTGSLGLMEWLVAIACSGIYVLLCQTQRYTRKHSRRAVIELQKELTKPRKLI
jgi:magnesium-transporting ATPase (P-type)